MEQSADLERPLSGAAWVNVADPRSPALDELAISEGLHPLDIEDCRHRNQIAKVTDYGPYSFIVIKTIRFTPSTLEIDFEDFDLFVKPSSLITVQETRDSVLSRTAADRLRAGKAPTHTWRIVHEILDAAVDAYLPALDEIGECIDRSEEAVLNEPSPQVLQRVLDLRRALVEFRRHATAMREVLSHLLRGVQPGEERYFYLRDVYDHIVRILDVVEAYRELVTGVLDIYLSAIANRTNQIVKVLTIWGTVALPLLVITGFYGMNLDLPLQRHASGLLVATGIMLASTAAVVYYFRRRGWF